MPNDKYYWELADFKGPGSTGSARGHGDTKDLSSHERDAWLLRASDGESFFLVRPASTDFVEIKKSIYMQIQHLEMLGQIYNEMSCFIMFWYVPQM